MKTKKVLLKDLKIDDTIRTPLLPVGFIKRVENFKKILSEVEKTSIEATILNFQKDIEPEKELTIWEYIASNYQEFITKYSKLSLEAKKDVLRVVLVLSTGAETIEGIKNLTTEQVSELKTMFLKYD